MKPFNAIIVDDEKEARDVLISIISDHVPEIRIIAQASSADEAIQKIIAEKPDIVFLDIDMPGKNGFGVAASISSYKLQTTIIFVTAFNQYAIDAIRCAAFDYLLKPVSITDLKACIARFGESKRDYDLKHSVDKLLICLNTEKIAFPGRSGTLFLDPLTIVYCEAEGNYTGITLSDAKEYMISQNLGSIETLLSTKGFGRISRSVLINKKFLHRIKRKEKKCILQADGREYSLDIKGSYLKKWEE